MIEETDAVFPNNVASLLVQRFQYIDEDLVILRRPLRIADPVQSIGIFSSMWAPDAQSMEMRALGSPTPSEPTINRYAFAVQAFIKDMDEERGLATHSVLSKMVLAILYRDQPLRVGLGALESEVMGVRERTLRWGVVAQRFLSNELGESEWLYLSTTEFYLDTETY